MLGDKLAEFHFPQEADPLRVFARGVGEPRGGGDLADLRLGVAAQVGIESKVESGSSYFSFNELKASVVDPGLTWGQPAPLCLGHPADGEAQARQLLLRQLRQEVGLVLAGGSLRTSTRTEVGA